MTLLQPYLTRALARLSGLVRGRENSATTVVKILMSFP